ncbi:MAG TPA: aldo/keto reductase, partial [Chloroflexota bacterium]|nr:aldo/keto reductase [Chloroflexota bacterium]
MAEQALTKRRLGRTDMLVTELALGGVGIGGLAGPVSETDAAGAVHRALDLGVNYIDTSPFYLESEARLGRVFRAMGGKPDGLYLSTKMGTHPARRGDYSAAGARWSVENSLAVLGVDAVDCVLLHDPRSDAELEQALGPAGAMDELERMRQEGKLRWIGLGVREHHWHRRAMQSGRIDVILTYADYTLVRQTAAALIAEAAAAGVGVLLGQAFISGLLAGPDPATDERLRGRPDFAAAREWWQWAKEHDVSLPALAIQYCLHNRRIDCVLVGAKTAR